MDEHFTPPSEPESIEQQTPEDIFDAVAEGATVARRLLDDNPPPLAPTFSSAAVGPYAPGERPKPEPQWPDEIRARDDEIRSLRHKATHDELTGLPNRMYLLEQLRDEVGRNPGNLALFFSDNDGLKAINDVSGHAAGDDLIKRTGTILEHSLRHETGDTVSRFVARLGGDEFVSLVPDVRTQEQLESIKGRLQTALADAGIRASIGARIHIAGETAEQFLDAVDKLMYQDKLARKAARTT